MNENIADEIRKTIESIKDMKIQVGGLNNYLSILEGMTRSDYQKKVDEAYQRGLEDGKKAFDLLDAERDSEYQRGLDDAWEAAKKIALMDTETSENVTGYFGLFRIMENLTPTQALEKLKAYEEKQKADDKIEVGDEVRRKSASENERGGIVTKDWKNSYFIMWTDGSSGQWDKDKVVKTGRHFDIDKILEEMRHD